MKIGKERFNRLALLLLGCTKPKMTQHVTGFWLEYLLKDLNNSLVRHISTSILFNVLETWLLSQFKTNETLLATVSSLYRPSNMIWHSTWKICNSVNLSLESQWRCLKLIDCEVACHSLPEKVTENWLRIWYNLHCWAAKPDRSSHLINMHEKQLITDMINFFLQIRSSSQNYYGLQIS